MVVAVRLVPVSPLFRYQSLLLSRESTICAPVRTSRRLLLLLMTLVDAPIAVHCTWIGCLATKTGFEPVRVVIVVSMGIKPVLTTLMYSLI